MMEYAKTKNIKELPRLPLQGNIDLTYRCNNNCRHCWLRIAPDFPQQEKELTFDEIRSIVDQARRMGCNRWSISGGEPMIRPDFAEIFDYLTKGERPFALAYSINTNGALITPKIAQLLKRKGAKMVALYGATAEVHDYITRNPGSFEATMRGFAYLKEAGAGFTVQLIPMKDNYHQFKEMVKLTESLSKHYRIGASWLYLSANGSQERNDQIARQRLEPRDVVELDKPDLSYEERTDKETGSGCQNTNNDGYLFSSCIAGRRDFHVDPYGKMSFCCFIKDPSLRYDLRKGSFQDAWDEFIPSLARKVKITKEYKENCGSCKFKKDCRICPVYAYLEYRDYNKKVEYLCAVARENRKFKENWQKNHRRYFNIADITIQVESDLPITKTTFHPKFKHFETNGPGEDTIFIRHHFSLPDLEGKNLGREVYRKPPWAIYKKNNSWIYLGIYPTKGEKKLHRVAVFNSNHTRAEIYNPHEEHFLKGGIHSLTMFPTDQILLARVLADKNGCYLHSCGVNFNGKGLLFAGHSEAGKSTMANILKGKAEILCDDRIIVREQGNEFRIHGTWSHGDVPDISAGSAPLHAILFLEKAKHNEIIQIKDKKQVIRYLIACLIKPLADTDWWDKSLSVIERIADTTPCYRLLFDKSNEIVEHLRKL
jgi:radical SAM protein with 4Fe4S-binding SPASM domain